MEWNLKTIGIITAIFFIGYAIGLVEAYIKQKNKDKKQARSEEKELVEIPPSDFKKPNLLSINRDDSNELILELEGQIIPDKNQLSPANKRLLVNLLVEVRPWLETTLTSVEQKTEKPPEPIESTPIPPAPIAVSESKPALSNISIVSQIDSVLQNRLAASSMANQGIRLTESPTGGVRVCVGLDKYDGIDSVPNPDIKEFIRQAVAEWERQT